MLPAFLLSIASFVCRYIDRTTDGDPPRSSPTIIPPNGAMAPSGIVSGVEETEDAIQDGEPQEVLALHGQHEEEPHLRLGVLA